MTTIELEEIEQDCKKHINTISGARILKLVKYTKYLESKLWPDGKPEEENR